MLSAKVHGMLVKSAQKNWKKTKEDKFCADNFDVFIKLCKNEGNVDVRNLLYDSRKKIIDQNKTRLRHVIKFVEFCGRQEKISKKQDGRLVGRTSSFRGEYSQLFIYKLRAFLDYSNHKQCFLFKAFASKTSAPPLEKSWLRPCFVIKVNVWRKHTFLAMVAIVMVHHRYMKLFKPFTPRVIAWSIRKGFNQSIRRTKEQKTRLQWLTWSDAEICNAIRSYEKRKASKKKRKVLAVLAKTLRLDRFLSQNFQAATLKQWRYPELLNMKVKIKTLARKQVSH